MPAWAMSASIEHIFLPTLGMSVSFGHLLECHLMSHVSMQAGIGDDLICYMMP
jgi:hypothetical protein